MLQVKTYLDKSPILNAGIGLFANEFIPKGTIIWKLDDTIDRIFTEEEYQKLNDLDKEFVDIYSFMYTGKYILCIDNARFFNHSNKPNCISDANDATNLGFTIAQRDIQIGEELTDDYSTFGYSEEDLKYNGAGFDEYN